jgi:hypothetical protein
MTMIRFELFKQNSANMARSHVDNMFNMAVCSYTISTKLRSYRTRISSRHNSDVDDVTIQRNIKQSKGAVGVTLKFHPKSSN